MKQRPIPATEEALEMEAEAAAISSQMLDSGIQRRKLRSISEEGQPIRTIFDRQIYTRKRVKQLHDIAQEEDVIFEVLESGHAVDDQGKSIGKIADFQPITAPRSAKSALRLYAAKLWPTDAPTTQIPIPVVIKFGVGEDTPQENRIVEKDVPAYHDLARLRLDRISPFLHYVPVAKNPGLPSSVLVMRDKGRENLNDTLMRDNADERERAADIIRWELGAARENHAEYSRNCDDCARLAKKVGEAVLSDIWQGRGSDDMGESLYKCMEATHNLAPTRKEKDLALESIATVSMESAFNLGGLTFGRANRKIFQGILELALKKNGKNKLDPYSPADDSLLHDIYGSSLSRIWYKAGQDLRERYLQEYMADILRISGELQTRKITAPLPLVINTAIQRMLARWNREPKEAALTVLSTQYIDIVRERLEQNRGAHVESVRKVMDVTMKRLEKLEARIITALETMGDENPRGKVTRKGSQQIQEKLGLGRVHEWREMKHRLVVIRGILAKLGTVNIYLICSEKSSVCAFDLHPRNIFTSGGNLSFIDLWRHDGMLGSSVIPLAFQLAYPFVHAENLPKDDAKYIRRRQREIMEKAGKLLDLRPEQIDCQRRLVTIMAFALKAEGEIRDHPTDWDATDRALRQCLHQAEEYEDPDTLRNRRQIQTIIRGGWKSNSPRPKTSPPGKER